MKRSSKWISYWLIPQNGTLKTGEGDSLVCIHQSHGSHFMVLSYLAYQPLNSWLLLVCHQPFNGREGVGFHLAVEAENEEDAAVAGDPRCNEQVCNILKRVPNLPDKKLSVFGSSGIHLRNISFFCTIEQPYLTMMHTLWLREHNQVAAELHDLFPNWGDERLYQEAKKITIAEYQSIVYNDWLPWLLGHKALGDYEGYKDCVDPTVCMWPFCVQC